MKNLMVIFSVVGMLLASSWSFAGGCSSEVVEFIRLKGGTKEGALSKISNEVSDAKRSYAAGTWGKGQVSGSERKELFDFMMQETSEMISNIRACTESDLASITPKAKASQSGGTASNCSSEIRSKYAYFKYQGNGRFTCGAIVYENLGGNECLADVDQWFKSSPMGLEEDEKQRVIAWAKCHLATHKGNSVTAGQAATVASVSPSIPNCPPTLPPTCVTWSLYDQQLQWWNLTNNCGRDVSVTFRSEGTLENTQTIGNGESYRAKWRGANPPRQIVWDAAKGFGFYRNKPAGAALKCQASLPL